MKEPRICSQFARGYSSPSPPQVSSIGAACTQLLGLFAQIDGLIRKPEEHSSRPCKIFQISFKIYT